MTEETLTSVGVFFYVIGNYSVMFLLHKNAPRGCDQMHEEHVCVVLGCRDFCTVICYKMITSKKSKEDWQMKGYNTSNGYMGYVEGKYILFASEQEYFEFMED